MCSAWRRNGSEETLELLPVPEGAHKKEGEGLLMTFFFPRKPADLQNLAPGTNPPFMTFDGEVKTDVNKIEEFLEEKLAPPRYRVPAALGGPRGAAPAQGDFETERCHWGVPRLSPSPGCAAPTAVLHPELTLSPSRGMESITWKPGGCCRNPTFSLL